MTPPSLPTVRLEEWDAPGEFEGPHVELVQGIPIETSADTAAIRRLGDRVTGYLNGLVPTGWFAVRGVGLTIAGAPHPTVRRPDIVVLPTAAPIHDPRQDPSVVALVVEVVSPSTRERDCVAKVAEYAAAGIPSYLVIDPGAEQVAMLTSPTPTGYAERTDDGDGNCHVAIGGERFELHVNPTVGE